MSATPEQIAERLVDIGEWKAIIEKHRRKTDDPSTTYVLKDGTRVHEDESVIAKLAASLSGALEDASTVAVEAAALIRAQSEREKVLAFALRRLTYWAQTSGGTAGRDDGLVAAIDIAVEALRAHDAALAGAR